MVKYTVVTDDGGTPLLSYELQKSNIGLDSFETLVGADPHTLYMSYTVVSGLVKGETYAFRYRAINAIGAGEWSDLSKLKAAAIPIAPPRPVYLSSTSTEITVGLQTSTDNGGSPVQTYTLYRDTGDLTSQVTT